MPTLTEAQLIWGCDPSRQFEVSWLLSLLQPLDLHQLDATAGLVPEQVDLHRPRVLVESGLLWLERSRDPDRLAQQQHLRQQRLAALASAGPLLLLHLSDEEGLDGDQLYPLLPPGTSVWRNFGYPRFDPAAGIRCFPIGPRREFLGIQPHRPASDRSSPWAFMGTLWASGSRTLAVSLFLRSLPSGQFYGGRHFGVGIPLEQYRQHLLDSVFALCPEGDRHFDTFRLYESLQMGCLPLVVERQQQARSLLGQAFPLPIFDSWPQALAYAQSHLGQPARLTAMQHQVHSWWSAYKGALVTGLRNSLPSTSPQSP